MVVNIQQTTRLVPFMSRARCRAYLLTTYLSRDTAKFSSTDINSIIKDVKKALDYLHSNTTAHGSVDVEHILIEKVSLFLLTLPFHCNIGKKQQAKKNKNTNKKKRRTRTRRRRRTTTTIRTITTTKKNNKEIEE